MYTRSNRQSNPNLPPDYSGTALNQTPGTPRYVARPSAQAAVSALAKESGKRSGSKNRRQESKASEALVSETMAEQNADSSGASSHSSAGQKKRSALTSAGSENENTYMRRPTEKPNTDSRLYAERDLYPPFGVRDYNAGGNTDSDNISGDASDNENNVAGSEPYETEEGGYIPPLSPSLGGIGLFTKRELNTDDLLLAGIILMMMENRGESEENNLETALLMAVIFMAGL